MPWFGNLVFFLIYTQAKKLSFHLSTKAEFTDLVGENSPFLSALLKVYKKKVTKLDVGDGVVRKGMSFVWLKWNKR